MKWRIIPSLVTFVNIWFFSHQEFTSSFDFQLNQKYLATVTFYRKNMFILNLCGSTKFTKSGVISIYNFCNFWAKCGIFIVFKKAANIIASNNLSFLYLYPYLCNNILVLEIKSDKTMAACLQHVLWRVIRGNQKIQYYVKNL